MSEASENLRTNQEQADRDGIMVKVSRQAVEEVMAEYDKLRAALTMWVEQGYIDADGDHCGAAAYSPQAYAASIAALGNSEQGERQ